jgi:hypothetical protein
MLKTMTLAISLGALCLAAPLAHAGEFFEKDGLAIGGYDPVAYFTQHKPVAGLPEFSTRYHDSTFRFASAEDRDAFLASPEKYAPQYHGYCAYGVAEGAKAPADPTAFSVYRDKLYFNYSKAVASKFTTDLPGYVGKADTNWPVVKDKPEEK